MTVRIQTPNTLGIEPALERVKRMEVEFAPLCTRWGVRVVWESPDFVRLQGSGSTRGCMGTVTITASEVVVIVRIPLALRWLEPRVEAVIRDRITTELGTG